MSLKFLIPHPDEKRAQRGVLVEAEWNTELNLWSPIRKDLGAGNLVEIRAERLVLLGVDFVTALYDPRKCEKRSISTRDYCARANELATKYLGADYARLGERSFEGLGLSSTGLGERARVVSYYYRRRNPFIFWRD